jgi:hypothetical protein
MAGTEHASCHKKPAFEAFLTGVQLLTTGEVAPRRARRSQSRRVRRNHVSIPWGRTSCRAHDPTICSGYAFLASPLGCNRNPRHYRRIY